MPEIRELQGYRQRRLRRTLILLIPGLLFFCLIWSGGSKEGSGVLLWTGIIGFVASALAAVIEFEWHKRHFRCPNCDRITQMDKSGIPLRFFCQRCDVLWKTGMSA